MPVLILVARAVCDAVRPEAAGGAREDEPPRQLDARDEQRRGVVCAHRGRVHLVDRDKAVAEMDLAA